MQPCRPRLPDALETARSAPRAPRVALLLLLPLVAPIISPSPPPGPAADSAQERGVAPAAAVPAGWWSKGAIPAGWQVVETQHYQMQTQIEETPSRALAEHMEAMLDLYADVLPARSQPSRLVIKLFARDASFRAYGDTAERRPSSAGRDAWFDADSGDVVTCDTGFRLGERSLPPAIRVAPDRAVSLPYADTQRLLQLFDEVTLAWTPDTAALLAREGWHQYLAAVTVSEVPAPPWLDAGLANCFAAATPEMSLLGRRFCRLGALNVDRLRAVRRAVRDRRAISLEVLLALGPEVFGAETQRDVHAAQAWAFVQFLLQHADSRCRDLPARLLRDWKGNKSADEATREALQGLDREALEHQWRTWIDDQPCTDPLATLAREFGGRIKPHELEANPHWRLVYHWHVIHSADAAQPAGEGK